MAYLLKEDGFEIIPSILTKTEIKALQAALSSLKIVPGHRNIMQRVPDITTLAISPKILGLLEKLLGSKSFPVRSIFFDKTPKANWLVPWHQDLSITVKQRLDLPGYGPWSTKDGVSHVQPPIEILEAMVTIRLHLDDCDDSNGALQVVPGSHVFGRLDAPSIAKIRSEHEPVICSVSAGDAFIMKPLLLHASSQARIPGHRRVIHLEYATCRLPEGLEWVEAIN